jgi:uncharacterized protein
MDARAELRDEVERLTLVDHHVHGAFLVAPDRDTLENAFNEGSTDPLPEWVSGFDSQLGFAVRRWCAPILDLAPHASADDYFARRAALGETEVSRRFLSRAGVSDWLIDTGFAAETLLSPGVMSEFSGGSASEILRLESLAESVILDDALVGDYPYAFRAALARAAADPAVVGTKTVIAYRTGFDIELSRPSDSDVRRAAAVWHTTVGESGTARLVDPTLLAFGIYAAVDAGLPVQFHVGFGDRDLDLKRVNPLELTDFLRDPDVQRVPVLLLHCYPFEREAGYLAQAFANVYLDVGLAVNYLGARASALVARSLELAPFAKILYSSDAWGPAELHYLGARLWRNSVTEVIGGWVERGEWSLDDGLRVIRMMASENAVRAYGL